MKLNLRRANKKKIGGFGPIHPAQLFLVDSSTAPDCWHFAKMEPGTAYFEAYFELAVALMMAASEGTKWPCKQREGAENILKNKNTLIYVGSSNLLDNFDWTIGDPRRKTSGMSGPSEEQTGTRFNKLMTHGPKGKDSMPMQASKHRKKAWWPGFDPDMYPDKWRELLSFNPDHGVIGANEDGELVDMDSPTLQEHPELQKVANLFAEFMKGQTWYNR